MKRRYLIDMLDFDVLDAEKICDIRSLYRQLSPEKEPNIVFWDKSPAHFRFFGAMEAESFDDSHKKIVSMATLVLMYTMNKHFGQVHDVVTDIDHRGKQFDQDKGLAEEVLTEVIKYARHRGLSYLELTSSSKRAAANKLYQKLGFVMYAQSVGDEGTNLYRLHLQ